MTDPNPNVPQLPLYPIVPMQDPLGSPITPKPKRKAWPWIVGSVAAVLLLCCGIGLVGAAGNDTTDATKPTPTASKTPPVVVEKATLGRPCTSLGRYDTTAAGHNVQCNDPDGDGKPRWVETVTVTSAPVPPPPPAKASYKTLTEREWKLIAKNPDAYTGKTYVVYGTVTQFDAATGNDSFRANVGHKNMGEDYEYETNTLLTGSAPALTNLVEGDEFRANVSVLGSFSYDTQMGGNTTAPSLSVAAIKVL